MLKKRSKIQKAPEFPSRKNITPKDNDLSANRRARRGWSTGVGWDGAGRACELIQAARSQVSNHDGLHAHLNVGKYSAHKSFLPLGPKSIGVKTDYIQYRSG